MLPAASLVTPSQPSGLSESLTPMVVHMSAAGGVSESFAPALKSQGVLPKHATDFKAYFKEEMDALHEKGVGLSEA